MLKITILLLGLFWCLRLWIEGRDAAKSRATLRHVVHVNGTRGKSTVCRLIEAGLRAGGLRVFCKTTGTDPMTIAVSRETPRSSHTASAREIFSAKSKSGSSPVGRARTKRLPSTSAWLLRRAAMTSSAVNKTPPLGIVLLNVSAISGRLSPITSA